MDTLRAVTLPLARSCGAEVALTVKQRAVGPLGHGVVHLKIGNLKRIERPIKLTDEGLVRRVRGVAWTVNMGAQHATSMFQAAKGVLLKLLADVQIFTDVVSARAPPVRALCCDAPPLPFSTCSAKLRSRVPRDPALACREHVTSARRPAPMPGYTPRIAKPMPVSTEHLSNAYRAATTGPHKATALRSWRRRTPAASSQQSAASRAQRCSRRALRRPPLRTPASRRRACYWTRLGGAHSRRVAYCRIGNANRGVAAAPAASTSSERSCHVRAPGLVH